MDTPCSTRRLATLSSDTRRSVGERHRDDADGRLDKVLARAQASEPAQCLDEADHPVAAHPEDEGAVEEDHARHAALVRPAR